MNDLTIGTRAKIIDGSRIKLFDGSNITGRLCELVEITFDADDPEEASVYIWAVEGIDTFCPRLELNEIEIISEVKSEK